MIGRGLTVVGDGSVAGDDDGEHRVPPHDIAAEQAVLGAAMLSPAACAEIAVLLDGGEFYRLAHQVIWEAITTLASRGDPIAVGAELGRAAVTADLPLCVRGLVDCADHERPGLVDERRAAQRCISDRERYRHPATGPGRVTRHADHQRSLIGHARKAGPKVADCQALAIQAFSHTSIVAVRPARDTGGRTSGPGRCGQMPGGSEAPGKAETAA